MKEKKAAKLIIKRAKEHPDWYTDSDVRYAKMVKKRIKQEKLAKRMKQKIQREYSEKDYWEGRVPDELFEEYLKKYGYAYTPSDYMKIPPRY